MLLSTTIAMVLDKLGDRTASIGQLHKALALQSHFPAATEHLNAMEMVQTQ